LYPAGLDELAVQPSVTECATGWVPVPESAIMVGEEAALLETVVLPVTLPAAAGAKVTLKVTLCPGDTISPVEIPPAVNPAPDILTPEIVIVEFPAFVKVTPCTELLPVLTAPKEMLVWVTFSMYVAGVTVSVAGLLTTFPTLLVMATVNCAPLSPFEVGGVVYEADVAPETAVPLRLH